MSQFSQLLIEAKALGVTGLEFEVTLTHVDDSDRKGATCKEDCWKCVAYTLGYMCRGYGRTGEEALRSVVGQVKEKLK